MKKTQPEVFPWRSMVLALFSAGLILVNPLNALASDSDRIAELERKLEQSLKQMEVFSAKIKQLEAANSDSTKGSGSTREADTQQKAKLEEIEQRVAQLGAAANRPPIIDGIPLHGFADVGAGWSGKGNPKGFSVGSLALYLTPRFTDNVKGLVELIFEYNEAGELATDLERVQLGYTYSDAATVWMGRFHTPYGYWNTGFHHGERIQTSLKRPRLIDFEDKGGILPAHSVGAWLTGKVKAGEGKVSYDLYLANAPRIGGEVVGAGTLNMNNAGSTNHSASLGFNAAYNFTGNLEGLRLGLHGLKADVRDETPAANATRLQMLGGYAFYDNNDWEVLAEYYHFNNKDTSTSTGTFKSWAGFAQVGHSFAKWTPYARLEKAILDQNDLYFSQQASGRSYGREALGVRYDLNQYAALKFELTHTRQTDVDYQNYSEARMQYAIRF